MGSESNQAGLADAVITAPPKRHKALAPMALVSIAFVLLSGYSLAHPLHDFVEYWTAARLLIAHANPYSIAEVSRLEHSLGFEQPMPLMLLSPPWALALVVPLGVTDSYVIACFCWMLGLIGSVALSSWLLMNVYFDDLKIPEISDTGFYRSLFAFTFFPVLLCLRFAQTAPLILLGLAGFLHFESKRRPFFAGAMLSITLIKPHLVFLVWLAVALYSWQKSRWQILAGAFASLAALTGIALWFDPRAFQDYMELTRSPYMQAYASGIGALVRKPFGGIGTMWIQIVPSLLGVIWFVTFWRKQGPSWSWRGHFPMLLTISVLTSAYGWAFDQTLLVLPVICLAGNAARIAGRIPFKLIVAYTILNCALMLLWPIPSIGLLPAPIFLAILRVLHSRRSESLCADSTVGVL